MPEIFHIPVMGQEVVSTLLVNPQGTYLDGTLGGGGHADLLLAKLASDAVYIAMDRDIEAIEYSKERLKKYKNIRYYHGPFNDLDKALRQANIELLDVMFFDLGVSSHQIDKDQRGFAYKSGLKLDMRMNLDDKKLASDILNNYDEMNLIRIFKEYGEEKYAKKIAQRLVKERSTKPFLTSDQLMGVIRRCVSGKLVIKSYARIFQALRIELNNELEILRETLAKSLKFLKVGGRLGVISYHSGEDRIVKMFFKEQEQPCTCSKDVPYCVCGKKPQLKRIRPYVMIPSAEEIRINPRARSAKYRVGERI